MSYKKIQQYLLHLIWITLLLMSIVFFRERTYGDTSFFLFKVINNGSFEIINGRIILIFSQLAALLGTYFGLSLQKLMIINSLWNSLFFYFLVLWLIYVIKNYTAAWILTIFLCLNNWVYFSPYLEVFYSGAFFICFVAAFQNKLHFNRFAVIYYILLWLALMGHPLYFAVFAFYLLYHFIEQKKIEKDFISVLLFFVFAIFVRLLSFSDYESKRITEAHLRNNQIDYTQLLDKGTVLFLHHYSLIIVLLLGSFIFLIRKNWKLSFFVLITYICFISFIIFNSLNTNYQWYNEVMYTPFLLIVLYPFLRLENIKLKFWQKSLSLFCFVSLIAISIYRIIDKSKWMNMQYSQVQRLASEAKDLYPESSKFRFEDSNFEKGFSDVGMHFAFQSMLYSSEYGVGNSVAFAENKMMEYDSSSYLLNNNSILIWKFMPFSINKLNNNYFGIKKGMYISLQATKYNGDLNFIIQHTRLNPLDSILYASANEEVYPLIQIQISDFIFPSNQKYHFYLSYHILDKDGKEVVWDGQRTSFETDIKNNFEQRISVLSPKEKGEYHIYVDVVKEGERWFGIKKEIKLIVD